MANSNFELEVSPRLLVLVSFLTLLLVLRWEGIKWYLICFPQMDKDRIQYDFGVLCG